MKVRAVLFDLDCTLTDRRTSIERAGRRLAELYPCCRREGRCEPLIEAMWRADRWGYRDREAFFAEVIERIGWTDAPAADELLRFWRDDYPQCSATWPGIESMLEDLRRRGLRLGIVTNGQTETQNRKIDVLGLRGCVDAVIVSGDVGIKKPDRRIFELALSRVGAAARETLFVGDHPINDIQGAQRAGLRACWIASACPWVEGVERPWKTVQCVLELIEQL